MVWRLLAALCNHQRRTEAFYSAPIAEPLEPRRLRWKREPDRVAPELLCSFGWTSSARSVSSTMTCSPSIWRKIILSATFVTPKGMDKYTTRSTRTFRFTSKSRTTPALSQTASKKASSSSSQKTSSKTTSYEKIDCRSKSTEKTFSEERSFWYRRIPMKETF